MPRDTPLPTLEAPDADPRLWLEEIEGTRALAWVEAQSRATLARFGTEGYEADRDALVRVFDRPDRIPFITRRGGFVYNVWRDEANPRGLWRRTTLERYRDAAPSWDLLLDLDALARHEGEDWVWSGATVEPDLAGAPRERALLRLSRGGKDAVVLREFDLGARRFVEGGFALAEAKGGAVWLDRNTLLLSSAIGEGMETRSGYARTVRLWRRGNDPVSAPVLFETSAEAMSAWGDVDRTAGAERLWFHEKPGFFDTIVWSGDRGGARLRIDLPKDAQWDVNGDILTVKLRTDWSVDGTRYPADTLLGLAWSRFLNGDRGFAMLFEPAPRRTLDAAFWSGGRLVLSILDDLAPRAEVLTPGEGAWTRQEIAALPRTGVVGLMPLDAEVEDSTGEVLVNVQTPVLPPELLLLDVVSPGAIAAPAVLKRTPPLFDAAGLTVETHEAVSVDGERIPYTQVGPAVTRGDAPVHMTGYGGFAVSEQPVYRAALGKLWLERGGTGVVANIRGGGEFGTRWHDAGRLANKTLAHEDFAAVASDLVRRGVTVPGRIAAEGGSNGGLLIANMLTRHPEKFGALFCTIPLIDMRRYAKLLAGASWIAEYGDPDRPEDWAFLRHISAYHAAVPTESRPPVLIATTRRDDRVHPGHARKMAARLQEAGYPAWFYELAAGGHGYGKDSAERAAFMALGFAFLRDAIGWTI